MILLRHGLKRARFFLVSEDGPTCTEYAILLAMLVLIAMGAIGGIGERIYNVYENIEAGVPMV